MANSETEIQGFDARLNALIEEVRRKADALVDEASRAADEQAKTAVAQAVADVKRRSLQLATLTIGVLLLAATTVGYMAMKDFMALQTQVISAQKDISDTKARLAEAVRQANEDQRRIAEIRASLERRTTAANGR
ncbi:hypothetical protein [Brevundimonas pondensis]|jgi:predicted  nucleic acid-binding Zn-ribbon protein|uniref:Uncharacterized protein n=1 Tax=Brevundimonas pondensis TaxID=2774189 RepID=A0ABX7SH30_9CAUL|nr:hypothetical protein [Brevundimonas pondensis]QTC86624.1 hypothetical protein IFE19_10725 [Brevundimonas pondensis]